MRQSPALAFDRASSVRRIDADGRLHVSAAHITKGCVSDYAGAEVPDFDKLGLDPDHIYRLYRDPVELAKAAPSFNNLPILTQHVAVSAADHRPDLVVGSTGTDARMVGPYLDNSLVIWSQAAIDKIDSGEQKELSCAYRYRTVMGQGRTADGIPFDGRMLDIVGSHLALVAQGRVGPDVVVGDAGRRVAGFFEMFPDAARLST